MMLALALAAAASPQPYRALGTEPFWSLTINGRRMRLERPATPPIAVAGVRRRVTARGASYVTAAMRVDVTRQRCSDGMSDRIFPDTVTVRIARQTLHGCGGAPLAAATLEGADWAVAAIDGRPAAGSAQLRFEKERVTGNAGCNRVSGTYRLAGERLVTGPLATTRMACVGPATATERRVLAVLAQPATVRWRGESIELVNAAGRLELARR